MFYSYVLKIPVEEEGTLLYNSINKSLIYIKTNPNEMEEFINNITEDGKNYLKDNLFLKDEKIPEKKIVNTFINTSKYSSKSLSFIIYLNYNCNLKCVYCYENKIKEQKVMDREIIDEVIKFIKKVIVERNPEEVEMCFIGGEPLLYVNKIETIISRVTTGFNNIVFYKSIITNGTLLNANNVKKIIELKIDLVQVTLDGPKIIHDRLRPYKNNRGSFDDIIKNLENINKNKYDLNIIINYNLSLRNIEYVENLFLDLKNKKIKYPIVFSLVFENDENSFEGACCIEVKNKIWLRAHRIGLLYGNHYEPFYRETFLSCAFFRDNNFIISPNGDLYSCISGIENEKYKISNIGDYGTYKYYSRKSQCVEKENFINKECFSCKYRILCGGGCVYKKNIYGNYCPKIQFIENDLPLVAECFKREEDEDIRGRKLDKKL